MKAGGKKLVSHTHLHLGVVVVVLVLVLVIIGTGNESFSTETSVSWPCIVVVAFVIGIHSSIGEGFSTVLGVNRVHF